jgi:tRNA-2-methylthio-N6-dimethylallyladenosine synthase
VTSTAPHYLIADGEPLTVRRTRAGDAWEVRQAVTPGGTTPQDPPAHGRASFSGTGAPAPVSPGRPPVSPPAVLLGMPSRRG